MILSLTKEADGRAAAADVPIHSLVIAGWTGRDAVALEHHIQELAELGVKRPVSVPCYYTVAADLLTTATEVEFVGEAASGEVEFVLVSLEDGLWVGVGSDHTDRQVETFSVTASKQVCRKPVAPVLWRFAEVERHWDQLVLRSWRLEPDGRRELYQEGTLARMRAPHDLVAGCPLAVDGRLPPHSAMFGGTLAAIGGIRPAPRLEIELDDPVLGRTIRHAYTAHHLPVTGE